MNFVRNGGGILKKVLKMIVKKTRLRYMYIRIRGKERKRNRWMGEEDITKEEVRSC